MDEDDDVLELPRQVLTSDLCLLTQPCRSFLVLTPSLLSTSFPLQFEAIIIMSYKAGIITAITGLKDRTGSSSIAIKKSMQATLPTNKKWSNAMFLCALKKMVADGILLKIKDSYKSVPTTRRRPSQRRRRLPRRRPLLRRRPHQRRSLRPRKRQRPKVCTQEEVHEFELIHLTLFQCTK